MIKVCNISKSFGKREVVKDINFTLKKGEITAFLGANGAGKTTIMNIMTGILMPDAGQVLINDINIYEKPLEPKRLIGYLPENNPLYADMYVREYLEYIALIYLSKDDAKESVERMIDLVDLKDECNKKIFDLSLGNKQRVGIAQALIHDPEIIILDEPTNGLDPNQQIKINNLIQRISKTKIVLFSSHQLNDIADIASRYLVLKKGMLVLDQPAKNIESIKKYFYSISQ